MEFENTIYYRVACQCSANDCDLSLEMEWDEELGEIALNMYKDLRWNSEWGSDYKFGWWWKDKWLRLKVASKVLFTGYIKVDGWLILQGNEHIDAFIEALEEGKNKINARKN